MKIKSEKDFWSGLIFLAAGTFVWLYAANKYQMGSALRMGPGYFPVWLGALQALLGAVVFFRSFSIEGPKVPQFHPKPVIMVLGSVVLYGYILKPAGLIVATVVLAFGAALGGHEFKFKEQVMVAAAMVIFCVLVFVKGLGLPFPLWPAFMS